MPRTATATADWQQLDRAHHLHPFTDHRELHARGVRVITRADGIYLWDSDGNRILDAMSGLWCVNIGYGRAELAEAARAQMLELPYYNSFFHTTHPPAVELSRLLAEVTPAGLNYFFPTNSGSEANDTVIRLVRHYWAERGRPDKNIIISRHNAYHGSSMGSASLGGMAPMHAQGGMPIPGIVHIRQPYWFEEGGDLAPDEFGLSAARALEDAIAEHGEERIAAFIAEPIQGAGGVVIPPATYWPEVNRILGAHDILLVADEVICGFGRTGKWFGSDTYALTPDLMPVAKGLSSGYLPIGGVMVADKVVEVVGGSDFFHGFTYSGHPAACAVAKANIEILRREKIVDTVANETAPYLKKRWSELADHPLVGEARCLGFLGALELVRDKPSRRRFDPPGAAGKLCRDICADNGLVMRTIITDTMVIAPPLIMSAAQIDEMADKVWECLDLTAKALAA